MMYRVVTVFLLFFIPLQLSWAAGAAYCAHEAASEASHFGHHSHSHGSDADRTDASESGQDFDLDTDCGACHAGCLSVLRGEAPMSIVMLVIDDPVDDHPVFPTPPFDRPERPNWVLFA